MTQEDDDEDEDDEEDLVVVPNTVDAAEDIHVGDEDEDDEEDDDEEPTAVPVSIGGDAVAKDVAAKRKAAQAPEGVPAKKCALSLPPRCPASGPRGDCRPEVALIRHTMHAL